MRTYAGVITRFAALLFVSLGGVISTQANMIQNPGFESESSEGGAYALNWKMNDPDDHGDSWGSASRENWRARGGEFIATVRGTWANAGDYGGWWQEAEAEPGVTYRFSAWFWVDQTWSPAVQELKLEFWNSDRSHLLGSFTEPLQTIGEEWVQRSVEGKAPDLTVWIRAVINVSETGAEGALQIDDAELVQVP